MIRDTTAQRIAADWHGGGGSALYALSSSGAILDTIRPELDRCWQDGLSRKEARDLANLEEYVEHHGPRPAVPDWYDRVIKAQR